MDSSDVGDPLKIVYLDNHLLAVDKPSGLPSQPDASGNASLIDLAKEYLRRKFSKPGKVFLGLPHRLDRPTSGLIVMAKTEKAAARMAEQFRRRTIGKTYLALTECRVKPDAGGELRHFLVQAPNGSMRIGKNGAAGTREARLSYRLLAVSSNGERALLEIDLKTGVKHQIRCQLAQIGLPVVGDFRYGPFGEPARPFPVMGGRAILLHAWRLGFGHPVKPERMELCAAPPGYWQTFLADFPLWTTVGLLLPAPDVNDVRPSSGSRKGQ